MIINHYHVLKTKWQSKKETYYHQTHLNSEKEQKKPIQPIPANPTSEIRHQTPSFI